MAPPAAAVLRKLQRVYYGPPHGQEAPKREGAGPPALLEIARSRGAADVAPPPPEVAVFVVGDRGSGKSCFINGYAQELVFPTPGAAASSRQPPPLQWVRGASADPAALPPLLAEAAAQFPKVFGDASLCLAGTAASPRLDAVDLVEVRAQALADAGTVEALAWIAARAGIVLCLADSQRQPAISAELLGFLRRTSAAASQLQQQQQPAAAADHRPTPQQHPCGRHAGAMLAAPAPPAPLHVARRRLRGRGG